MSFRSFVVVTILIGTLLCGWWGYKYVNSEWIEAGHVGLIYSANGGLDPKVYPPGRVWVPPYHALYTYPTMTKAAIYTQDKRVGEERAADGVPVPTNDNWNTIFDIAVFYRVRPKDVPTAFRAFGRLTIDEIQRQHIRRALRDAVNAVGPHFDAFGLMGADRLQASAMLAQELRKRLGYKGITVEKALFCQAYPSAELMAKVQSTVNSLTELTISRTRARIAKQEKTAAITRARAEAQAARMTAAQADQRSIELRSLDVTASAIEHWNGHLAPVQAKRGQIINIPGELVSALAAARPVTPAAPQPDAARVDAQEGK